MHEKHGFAWEADFSAESRLQVMDLYGWDKMVCFNRGLPAPAGYGGGPGPDVGGHAGLEQLGP